MQRWGEVISGQKLLKKGLTTGKARDKLEGWTALHMLLI